MKKKIDLSGPSLFPWVVCTKCGNTYPDCEIFFYYRNGKRVGKQCRGCVCGASKDWSEKNKERKHEMDRLYRLKNKDKIAANDKIYKANNRQRHRRISKRYRENHPDRVCAANNRWRSKNKDVVAEWDRKYNNNPVKYNTFFDKLTIDESPISDDDGYLLVKCAYCGRYFTPSKLSVMNRIVALNKLYQGESRLYCSNTCKAACPIYNRTAMPKGFKPASSREVDPLIRQMCLARDNYECQKCGVSIEDAELHAHHIEGAVQQPMLANDVENTITLCKQCHRWVHSQEGCTTYDLRCKK